MTLSIIGRYPLNLRSIAHLKGRLLEDAFALRIAVFCDEQGVPVAEERDAWDATACHVGLVRGAEETDLVATGRVRLLADDPRVAKVERVVVRADYRGLGAGRQLMAALETEAAHLGAVVVKLAAQDVAIPFYERLSYAAYGPEFLDAGIAHRAMRRDF